MFILVFVLDQLDKLTLRIFHAKLPQLGILWHAIISDPDFQVDLQFSQEQKITNACGNMDDNSMAGTVYSNTREIQNEADYCVG